MAIIPQFTRDDVARVFDKFLDTVEKRQVARLQQLGEMCLIEARQNKGYMMQTGALLSSTGYEVFVGGRAIHSQFDAAQGAQSEGAQTGMQTGKNVAESIGKETTGVCLVVVAGMNYATYVEAKGKNVLTSAERLAERELPKLLQQLITNVRNAVE